MKKKYILLYVAGLTAISSYATSFFWEKHERKTDGFSLSKIQSDLSFNPEYAMDSGDLEEQRELACAISQNYHYIGSGGQCFAFCSEDGKYVLKLLKYNRRKIPFYANYPMPGFLRQRVDKSVKTKRAKLTRDFTSYCLAMQELKEESGLIFVHLNKTKNIRKSVQITDKASRPFIIHLDDHEFLIQKKADLIYPTIDRFMSQGQVQIAKNLLHNIVSSIISRSQKEIYDEDARINRNFGCIEDKVIFIDVGRFRKDATIVDSKILLKDIRNICGKFQEWLIEKHPELNDYLEEELHALEEKYN